jgi:pimeloyl-ACP methyl ester carboxylesterase
VWDLPDWTAVLRSFGEYARAILFDRRGIGVSDRPTTPDAMALEKSMDDMLAVMGEVGSKRAALLGYQSGGTVMILVAATYPEHVSALALYSPLIFYWKTPDFPWGWTEEEAAECQRRIESGWGTEEFWRWNAQEMGETDVSDQQVERYARWTRLSASPQAALAIEEVERQVDVRAILPQIQVPTLVMGTRGEVERGYGAGSWIAGQIPGARYVEIPDNESFPVRPVLDDCEWPSVATAVRYFELNTGWEPQPFEATTRLRAYRLPDPRVEPTFESFAPFGGCVGG